MLKHCCAVVALLHLERGGGGLKQECSRSPTGAHLPVLAVCENLSVFLQSAAALQLAVISSHTLLGHIDKPFFKNKEGKQTNKGKETHVNRRDNNKGQ